MCICMYMHTPQAHTCLHTSILKGAHFTSTFLSKICTQGSEAGRLKVCPSLNQASSPGPSRLLRLTNSRPRLIGGQKPHSRGTESEATTLGMQRRLQIPWCVFTAWAPSRVGGICVLAPSTVPGVEQKAHLLARVDSMNNWLPIVWNWDLSCPDYLFHLRLPLKLWVSRR